MSFNFIGGFTEDYSPRDSLSESSEEVRGGDLRGEVSIYVILVNGVCAIRYISVEVAANLKGQISCCFSGTKSCATLCNPMDCSMPGFPVHHYLPDCWNSGPLSQWCHPAISFSVTHFSCPQSFPASGSFPMSWLFKSGGQSTGASGSIAVLPVNIQGWFPLGLTGLISLQSKGLSRVFSSSTVQKHQLFSTQPSFWSRYLHSWF